MKILIILCSVTLMLFFNSAFAVDDGTTQENDSFLFTDLHGQDCGYGTYCITGVFKNKTNKEYAAVFFDFTLYDNDGQPWGIASSTALNVKALGSSDFVAYSSVLANGVSRFTLRKIRVH